MMELQNSEILIRQLSNPRIIKAIAQLLVLVCAFYYFFSHSSCCSFILHSSKFYLSAIPLQSLDKRWMFLICNGIFLVILGSSSSNGYDHPHKPTAEEEVRVFLIDSSAELDGNAVFSAQNEKNDQKSSYEEDDEVQKSSHADHQRCNEEEQGDNSLTMIAEDDEGQSEQAGYELLTMDRGGAEEAEDDEGQSEQAGYELLRIDQRAAEEAEEIKISIIIEDNEDDEGRNENYSDEAGFDNLLEEAEEEEGEGEVEAESRILEEMSTEELNKRFEDFIRKMKEEVRIEPQQQHLVVVK